MRGAGSEERGVSCRQRRGALVSGVVLAAMAVGIYLVVMLKFFARS